MKTCVLSFALLMAGAAGTVSAQTAAPTKVGIIHIQNAIIGTKEGQKAAGEMEARSAPKKKELERRQGEIAALREQYTKTSSVGSEEQKQRLTRDIDQKTKAFNRDVEDAQAELDQEQGKVLNELGGRMLAVLDKYARDNGYAIILDVSAQQTPVLFAANNIDVTQDIVALFDKNSAAGAAAPPPISAPAAKPLTPMTPAPKTTTPPAPKPTTPK